ncbi:MAG: EAL domain-containing protein [Synechococcus sp.]
MSQHSNTEISYSFEHEVETYKSLCQQNNSNKVSKIHEYKLEVDDGINYTTYMINGEKYSIGRNSSFSIYIPNTFVSHHHATLERVHSDSSEAGFSYLIRDGSLNGKSSKNGIYVNGNKVTECLLSDGDIIRIGPNVKARFTHTTTRKSENTNIKADSIIDSDGSIFHAIKESIFLLNIDGTIRDINKAALRLVGIEEKDIIGKDFAQTVLPEPWKSEFIKTISRVNDSLDESMLGRWSASKIKRSDGHEFHSDFSISLIENNNKITLMIVVRDITSQKIIEQQLQLYAYQDPLTLLGNRRYFLEGLGTEFSRFKHSSAKGFALIFLDLNRFKYINDTLGHDFGDSLLIVISKRIKKNFRDEDIVARLGGDEFTVLVKGIQDRVVLTHIIRRLIRSLQEPIQIREKKISISLSIGVVISTQEHLSPEELMRDADFAMYQAKESQLHQYIFFDNQIGALAQRKIQLEQELRNAIEREEFELYYQPIVSLETDYIVSFESLLRWDNPKLGWVSPSEFIPVCEESGLIKDIGIWILRQACYQLKQWNDRNIFLKSIGVSVNVSGKQIVHPLFVEELLGIINETRVSPKNLKLEITESMLIEDFEQAKEKLEEINALGIDIYLDDFGTGYSSFGYLHQLPVNVLKIDRSFTAEINTRNGLKIVESMVALAKVLEIEVVAEGVEIQEQIHCLKKMNCDKVQGYYISKPMSSDIAEEFASEHNNKVFSSTRK